MIEEPYRWVEAIANRREYIEHQIAPGSPIVGLSFPQGILLFTLGRQQQKIFEIYDRIAMGGIGHPGDIERLRMAAIEVASTEGFTRSANDVSLRRLTSYSMSPALKSAFEQVYGPPYLARMLFAEVGRESDPDLFVRLDYDGSIHSSGGGFARESEGFGIISGTTAATAAMERFLGNHDTRNSALEETLRTALDAWLVGNLAQEEQTAEPGPEKIAGSREAELASRTVEAVLLERNPRSAIAFRPLTPAELQPLEGR